MGASHNLAKLDFRGGSKASCYFVRFTRKTPWHQTSMALQNQCMKPPPQLFLNKLLKPNTENVWGPPPASLGNLLILPPPQKKSSYKNTRFRVGGALEMYEKFPSTPPSSYILRGVGLSFYQSIYLSTCLSVSLKTLLFYETSSFSSWQHQKRSTSARLPHLL